MHTYRSLIDYLGDQRGPESLTIPPGGDMGPANAYACDIAETIRTIPSKLARISFLRNEAALLARLQIPGLQGHEPKILKRLANWCDELQLLADNSNNPRAAHNFGAKR